MTSCKQGASPETRLAMVADKIEGAIGTVMSTTGRYRLEKIIHRQRRTDGEMTPEQISDHWQAEMAALYGDSVEITDRLRLSWSYIPHFVNSPFYSYPYTFGELFALSLYQKSKTDGPAFAERLPAPAAGGRQRLAAQSRPHRRRRPGRSRVLARRLPRRCRADRHV